MLTYDEDRARAAVQYLVDTPYFSHHLSSLRTNVARPRSLPYRGEVEPLNELLVIGRQSLQAMENLIEVARYKRDTENDKQAALMRARRARERMAVELEELLVGRKFNVEERRKFLQRQYDQWNVAKDKHIAKLGDEFTENNNEFPGWTEKNIFTKHFWAEIDKDLPLLIAEAKKVLGDRKAARKRVVIVEKPRATPTNPAVKEALSRAFAGKITKKKR